jgi:hypothetical protein
MPRAFCFVLALILCTPASAQTPSITGVSADFAQKAESAAGVSAAQRLSQQKEMQKRIGGKTRSAAGVSAALEAFDKPATLGEPNNTACGRYPYPPCNKATGEEER